MFLLGHACWAYLFSKAISYPIKARPNLYLLLILGMLPDIDLILGSLDVQHRTATHSIVMWSVVFAPFFVKYKLVALPYFVAPVQHILFGDLVVGKTNFLWPIADFKLGLGLPIASPASLILEGVGFALFAAWILFKDRSLLLRPGRRGLLSILVIVPLAGFVIFSAVGGPLTESFLDHSEGKYLERSVSGFLSSSYLQVVIAMHLALLFFMLIPAFVASKTLLVRVLGKEQL